MTALDFKQKHLLRLCQKDADANGWTKVSKVVWPFVEALPAQLIELRPSDDGGHARLTKDGLVVLEFSP